MINKILADTLYAPHLNCSHPPAARAVTTRHARITWYGRPLTNLPHLTWDQIVMCPGRYAINYLLNEFSKNLIMARPGALITFKIISILGPWTPGFANSNSWNEMNVGRLIPERRMYKMHRRGNGWGIPTVYSKHDVNGSMAMIEDSKELNQYFFRWREKTLNVMILAKS